MFGTPESGTGVLEGKDKVLRCAPEGSEGGSFLNDPDLVQIPLTERLPDEVYSLQVFSMRPRFAAYKREVNRCLEHSGINLHDEPHEGRVANGVWQLGEMFHHTRHKIYAAVFGARNHDIGYNAKGRDPRTLSKEDYADHPERGAQMFDDAINEVRPPWWGPQHSQIARDSILYHNNGSRSYTQYWKDREGRATTWDDVLPMYTRFVDKIDNTYERVYPSHMEELGKVLGLSPEIIRTQMRANMELLLSSPKDAASRSRAAKNREHFLKKQHGGNPQEVFDQLRRHDPRFIHRVVPYAITAQHLLYSPKKKKLGVIYDVDTDRVGSVLGIQYTPDDHYQQFLEAYERSCKHAADIGYRIHTLLTGEQSDTSEPMFSVIFNYGNKEMREVEFLPLTSEKHVP